MWHAASGPEEAVVAWESGMGGGQLEERFGEGLAQCPVASGIIFDSLRIPLALPPDACGRRTFGLDRSGAMIGDCPCEWRGEATPQSYGI